MTTPLVSVIIPTYNRANCVGEAIQSVLDQTYQDFELIVVDDGSNDNTGEVLGNFGSQIKVIRQENAGVSSARNVGVRAARGEWVAFLDSDDIWKADKLKVQIQDAHKYPQAVAHMVDGTVEVNHEKSISLFQLRGLLEEFILHPLRVQPLCDVLATPFFTPCWMVKREIIQTAGYFDPKLKIFEDLDLLSRVALEGTFVVNSFIGVHILRRTGGDSHSLSEIYQRARMESLQNLKHTYSRLKKDPRLTNEELRHVRRLLGGVCCEIASTHLQQRERALSLRSIIDSLAEDPGLRSLGRAFVTLAGMTSFIHRVFPRRYIGNRLRRSEIHCGSLH